MGRALFHDLVGKERGVNAAEHDPRAPLTCQPPDGVAAQGIAAVNADAHDVAGGDVGGIDVFKRLVDQMRIAPAASRSPPPGHTASAA